MGRLEQPKDLVGAVVFFASDGAPRASPWSPKTIPTSANLPSPAGFAKAGASVGHPPVSEIRRSMID
jgi:hypothetical protein